MGVSLCPPCVRVHTQYLWAAAWESGPARHLRLAQWGLETRLHGAGSQPDLIGRHRPLPETSAPAGQAILVSGEKPAASI